jgi:hypothetical protein
MTANLSPVRLLLVTLAGWVGVTEQLLGDGPVVVHESAVRGQSRRRGGSGSARQNVRAAALSLACQSAINLLSSDG